MNKNFTTITDLDLYLTAGGHVAFLNGRDTASNGDITFRGYVVTADTGQDTFTVVPLRFSSRRIASWLAGDRLGLKETGINDVADSGFGTIRSPAPCSCRSSSLKM